MREYITMQCTVCSERNYQTSRETRGQGRLELKKFCKKCGKHTAHRERKK